MDLEEPSSLADAEAAIRAINSAATIRRTERCVVEVAHLLDLAAYAQAQAPGGGRTNTACRDAGQEAGQQAELRGGGAAAEVQLGACDGADLPGYAGGAAHDDTQGAETGGLNAASHLHAAAVRSVTLAAEGGLRLDR